MANVDEWASHTARVQAAKPEVEACLEQITGWKGVGKLADYVIELIIANQGRSNYRDVRPPCWKSHAPRTVPEFAAAMAETMGRSIDDSEIQQLVEAYRQELIARFGLEPSAAAST